MRALIAVPGEAGSARYVEDWTEPTRAREDVLVESIVVGLCGSDRELFVREPSDDVPFIVGHESLGRVVQAPGESGFTPGDLVFGLIRRPCRELCSACLLGRLDECTARQPSERGLFGTDGFASDLWSSPPRYLARIDPTLGELGVLAEPLTCLVKLRRRLAAGGHAARSGTRVLIAGAGTIGLLAAWLWSRDGAKVTLVDRAVSQAAQRAADVLERGSVSVEWPDEQFDLVIDATGSSSAIDQCSRRVRQGGALALIGIPQESQGHDGVLHRVVMSSLTVFGSVNASLADHRASARLLGSAPREFLNTLVTREISPSDWPSWVRGGLGVTGGKAVVRFSESPVGVTRIRDTVDAFADSMKGDV